ncbi:MAG: helix-turn-helix domain-containing protein [Friedmanniella sp.]
MSKSSSGSSKTGSTVLAQLIRDRRHRLGMTRQQLAEATGVPYSTVAQIETAYRGVSPSRLGVIARALQLDPAELYDILASEPTAEAPAAPASTSGSTMQQENDSWHHNPNYSTAATPPRAAPASGASGPVAASQPDIVARAVELISQLPAELWLETLGKVQAHVLTDLVHREAQQRHHRSD